MNIILQAIIWIFPAYIANAVATIFGGGAPLDFGKKLSDGKRILGNGKTIRGTIAGIFVGALVGYAIHDLTLGFLLASGAILGDVAASFVKRRIGKKSGAPWWVVDQLDFVAGAFLLASFYQLPCLRVGILIVLITPLIHLGTNFTAFKLGIKKVWW